MHESEKWNWSHSVMSDSQRPHRLQPTRLLCPWDFPGKSTGVGCHWLLPRRMLITLIIQDIFLLITYQNVNIPTCLSHHSEFLNNKLVNITLFITNLPALFSEQVKPNKSNMSETLYPGNRKEPRVIVCFPYYLDHHPIQCFHVELWLSLK